MLIIKRPTHKKVARERKRLRKFKKLHDQGRMTEFDIHNAYKSWRNTVMLDCNACHKTIESTDALYEELFPVHEVHVRQKRKDVLNTIWKENAHDFCRCRRKGFISG